MHSPPLWNIVAQLSRSFLSILCLRCPKQGRVSGRAAFRPEPFISLFEMRNRNNIWYSASGLVVSFNSLFEMRYPQSTRNHGDMPQYTFNSLFEMLPISLVLWPDFYIYVLSILYLRCWGVGDRGSERPERLSILYLKCADIIAWTQQDARRFKSFNISI